MEKNQLKQQKEKRKALRKEKQEFQIQGASKYTTVLEALKKKFKKNPNAMADNLMSLLEDKNFLLNCYETLKANKGALTQGTEKDTADSMADKRIEEIVLKLINKTFKFRPSRRIEVPKPGKTTMRPLTIPNFDDRIIQEGIRVILNAIYEPIFQELQVNFGFRPKLGTDNAMQHIQTNQNAKATTAIEGDIKGAYDNVQIKKMMEILAKRIKDKFFLKLIKQGFESGIFCKDIFENTTLGIPQGGIASPILFNIYMHEFDIYVLTELQEFVDRINTAEKRRNRESKNWRTIRYKRGAVTQKMNRILKKVPETNKFQNMTPQQKENYRNAQKQFKQLTTKLRSIPSKTQKDAKLYLSYTRYADDWIILTNASKLLATAMKDKIQVWLEENLKLQLSIEKTKITDLYKENALFLGFRIKNNQKTTLLVKRRVKIKSTGEEKIYKQRASRGLFIDIDHDRLTQRLTYKQIITPDKNPKPRHKTIYIVLKEHEIINRYRMHMEGLYQYYWNSLTFKSSLARYYYYLYYSCLKTLATRQRSSIRKIISKYGKNLIFKWEESYINKKEEKIILQRSTYMPSYIKLMDQTKRRMVNSLQRQRINTDFMTIKVNLRTAYKFTKYCCICGCSSTPGNPIESHHVRSVRKIGQTNEGFQKIMRQLNSRQIVCCKKCHQNIHNGKYNQMKLSEFYDPILAENI